MKVMVLAAGRGKRLRPLTDATPKPLLQVGQYALIEHLLLALSANGFLDIVINVSYLADKIVGKLQDGKQYGVTITYSHETQEGGLETGGGIFHALPLLGVEPFLVISGDIWTNYPFAQLRAIPLSGLVHLVLVNNPPDYPQGDFQLFNGKLVTRQGVSLTYGNIGIFHPQLFEGCKPGFFPVVDLLTKAVGAGQASGELFQGEWMNVGTSSELDRLRRQVSVAHIIK